MTGTVAPGRSGAVRLGSFSFAGLVRGEPRSISCGSGKGEALTNVLELSSCYFRGLNNVGDFFIAANLALKSLLGGSRENSGAPQRPWLPCTLEANGKHVGSRRRALCDRRIWRSTERVVEVV